MIKFHKSHRGTRHHHFVSYITNHKSNKKLTQKHLKVNSYNRAFKAFLAYTLNSYNSNRDEIYVPIRKNTKYYVIKVMSKKGLKQGTDGNLGIYKVYRNGHITAK